MDNPDPRKLHYSQLKPAAPDDPLATEYEIYRREVGRWIAEGHEGKHILIKDGKIVGLYDTEHQAMEEGYRGSPRGGFLVHQIQTWERLYRVYGQMVCLIGPMV